MTVCRLATTPISIFFSSICHCLSTVHLIYGISSLTSAFIYQVHTMVILICNTTLLIFVIPLNNRVLRHRYMSIYFNNTIDEPTKFNLRCVFYGRILFCGNNCSYRRSKSILLSTSRDEWF